MGNLIALGVALLFIYLIWQAARPRWDVHIVVEPESVTIVRGIAAARMAEVKAFLRDGVPVNGRIEVLARKDPDGRLITAFKGPIDTGIQQRVRNFLIQIL